MSYNAFICRCLLFKSWQIYDNILEYGNKKTLFSLVQRKKSRMAEKMYFLCIIQIKRVIFVADSIGLSNIKTTNRIMAKRRILKKRVNNVIGELFTECVVVSQVVPGVDAAKVDAVLVHILNVQNDFVCRISHTEPGNVKGFYKAFRADFQKQVEGILDEMGALH